MRLPLAISLIIGAFWISAANAAPVLATVMIVAMAAAAIAAMLRAGHSQPWFQARPIAVYAGWLTAATGAAIGILLGGYAVLSPQTAAVFCIAGVLVISLFVQKARPQEWGFSAAVIWALVGIVVANLHGPNWPVIGLCILGIGVLTLRAIRSILKEQHP